MKAMPGTHRRVFISGVGSALGVAVANAFAARGGHVVLADSDGDKAEAAVSKVRAEDGKVWGMVFDPTDANATADAVRAAGRIMGGGLDIAIVGGERFFSIPFLETSADQFRTICESNLVGTFSVFRATLREMIARSCPNGSLLAILGESDNSANNLGFACKSTNAAVIDLVQTAALEMGSHGIRANAVFVPVATWGEPKERHVPVVDEATLKKLAELVVYLTGETAKQINGQAVSLRDQIHMRSAN